MRIFQLRIIIILVFILLLTPHSVFAATGAPDANALDAILDAFQTTTKGWESIFFNCARQLFGYLAIIQIIVAGCRLVIRGGVNMDDLLTEGLKQLLTIGVAYALLIHSSEWIWAIINGIRGIGAQAALQASGGLAPSDVMEIGLNYITAIVQNIVLMNPLYIVPQLFGSIIIMICYALMAGLMVIALVEGYLISTIGILFVGFGASEWTRDLAIRILSHALGIGTKLLAMELVLGIGITFMKTWATYFLPTDFMSTVITIALSFGFLLLTKVIPDLFYGIASGKTLDSGWAVMSAVNTLSNTTAAMTSAMVSAGAGLLGAGSAASAAAKLAAEQAKDAAGSASENRPDNQRRFGAHTGQIVKNLAQAGAEELGMRYRGEIRHGSAMGRMSHRMRQQADDLSEKRNAGSPQETETASQPKPNSIYTE